MSIYVAIVRGTGLRVGPCALRVREKAQAIGRCGLGAWMDDCRWEVGGLGKLAVLQGLGKAWFGAPKTGVTSVTGIP